MCVGGGGGGGGVRFKFHSVELSVIQEPRT